MPVAQPRRAGGNAPLSRLSANGMIIAAPAPCIVRAAISAPMSVASAQPAEAAANSASPAANIRRDRKSTRLNSSHMSISYAVFCLKKKKKNLDHNHHANARDNHKLD